VDTLAGLAGQIGNIDGAGRNARFSHPQAISVSGQGDLYVADAGNQSIRKVTPKGHVSTLAARKSSFHSLALNQ
jgi:hypothetical protein